MMNLNAKNTVHEDWTKTSLICIGWKEIEPSIRFNALIILNNIWMPQILYNRNFAWQEMRLIQFRCSFFPNNFQSNEFPLLAWISQLMISLSNVRTWIRLNVQLNHWPALWNTTHCQFSLQFDIQTVPTTANYYNYWTNYRDLSLRLNKKWMQWAHSTMLFAVKPTTVWVIHQTVIVSNWFKENNMNSACFDLISL